jgi:hypothetical protein
MARSYSCTSLPAVACLEDRGMAGESKWLLKCYKMSSPCLTWGVVQDTCWPSFTIDIHLRSVSIRHWQWFGVPVAARCP